MKNTIEKLGITQGPYIYRSGSNNCYDTIYAPNAGGGNGGLVCTIGQYENSKDVNMFLYAPILLETLIDQCRLLEDMGYLAVDISEDHPLRVIEKSTGKSWGEIRMIVEGC